MERNKKMEQEILKKLEEQDKKIESIWGSVEKTRKYFLATIILTVAMTVLPLIGLVIAVPFILNTFFQAYGGLL
ncbi:MAG: hypothetical protein ACD_15C00045G0023 [uncultured bacterium]|nr:MAG: hypothetical protein ACD_15C00045G0023 [uncultured bacterium]